MLTIMVAYLLIRALHAVAFQCTVFIYIKYGKYRETRETDNYVIFEFTHWVPHWNVNRYFMKTIKKRWTGSESVVSK